MKQPISMLNTKMSYQRGFPMHCEKLGGAVWTLATGWGTLRERLVDAAINSSFFRKAIFQMIWWESGKPSSET
jgi:hypothetical protein